MEEKEKVDAPIIGANGNIFNLIGICRKVLTRAGQEDNANELTARVKACGSYDEALNVLTDYVNPISIDANTLDEEDDELD